MIEAKIESLAVRPRRKELTNQTENGYISSTSNIRKKHSIYADDFQSLFVASRYNLEPHIARLICDLAGIGDAR